MATVPLGVRLLVGAEAPLAEESAAEDAAALLALPVSLLGKECLMDSAGNLYARVEALPRAAAHLRPPAGAVVAGSAKRLLALAAGAMREAERMDGVMLPADRAEPSQSASTASDMDIDSGGDAVSTSHPYRDPGAKRRRGGGGDDDTPGVLQRPAKRRILAWRVRQYRYLVAKARATARTARIRATRRRTSAWKGVQRQLARATLSCDGLHRWSPGGGVDGGAAGQ